MLKRFFHLFLVGMLIFSSLGNSLPAFAQFESPPIDIEEEKADPPNPEESDFPDEEESDFPDEEESDLPDSEESDLPDEEESSMEIEEFFVESEIEIMSTYSDIIPLQDGPSPLYVYVSKISNAKCSIAENAIFANVCDAININEPNTTQLQRLCGIWAATANNIITYLQTNSFTTIADLTKVSGIGAATLQNIINVDEQCKAKRNKEQEPEIDNSLAQLIISEVYYDDYEDDEREEYFLDEERIEIFNIGEGDFYGSFTLSGKIFKNHQTSFTYSNVFIPAGSFIILANTGYLFQLPNNSQGLLINQNHAFPDFDIPDTEELNIELLIDGNVVDVFSADVSRVRQRDDRMVAFQKILLPDKTIVTNSREYSVNIKRGYKANPGALLRTNDDDYVDYTIPRPPKPIDPTPPDACSKVEKDLLTLTEVFRWNNTYDPYLEFLIHEDLHRNYEKLLLTGSLLQTSLTLNLSHETESYDRDRLQKNTRLIVTKQVGNLAEAGLLTIVYHPDFELNTVGGELQLYGLNGQHSQLLDIATVVSATPWKSTYYNWLVRRCWNLMNKVDSFSPGFGQEVLTYFSPTSEYIIKTVETVKYVGGGGGCSCPSAEQLCGDTPLTKGGSGEVAGGSWTSTGSWTIDNNQNSQKFSDPILWNSPIKILAIEPKNPESITLQSFLPYDIDFSKHTYYLKTSTATTKKYIDGILPAYTTTTFTKNFGFLDAGACVYLYSGDLLLDEICYTDGSKTTKGDPFETPPNSQNSQEFSGPILWNSPIKILAIEPKNPESITLQSFLPYDIDFNKRNLYLKTSTATTKKYIDGILSAYSVDTFTKNFGFLDAGACVYLFSGDIQLDEICYTDGKTPKEAQAKFDPSLYQVKILDILYDPPGADTDNETITLHNQSNYTLDLANLKLKINTTNKKLTGILEPWEIRTLKGTFGFPNSTKDGSEVVVSIFYDTTIYDTYLYDPNKPKVVAQSGEVKVYSVLDGDTFRFRKEDGTLQSVRLLGVDAPESTLTRYRTIECFGKESKTYLTDLIKNKAVRLDYDPTQQQVDVYGRLIAYVYLWDVLVNEKIIADGYAKEYTYKSDYEKQSTFLRAEQQAKVQKVWLRSPSTCWISIEDVPEARGFDYDKLPLKITHIDYDPPGSDKDNETVVLSLSSLDFELSSLAWIDFSDNFKLHIFPRSEYTTGTTKNKSLASVWFLPLSSTFELKGDRQLPNSKATCVSLKYKEYTFDTKCYHPGMEEIVLEGEVDSSTELPAITIRSLLPNPVWADAGKEEIVLYRDTSKNSQEFLENYTEISLSPDFYLLINNKTKKKLTGILTPNQEITLKGTFSLPNSASCVALMMGSNPIDSFCYSKPGDGVRFYANNTSVQEIPAEDLAIVKKITLVRQKEKLCISYNKVIFGCRVIPNSTTEKNTKLLSFQNNYIAEVEKHLKNNYSLLYYNSDLKDLFTLYTDTKREIKAGSYSVTRKWEEIPLTDVASVLSTQYNQSAQEYLTSALVAQLPPSLLKYYQQEKAKYRESLRRM